MITIKHKTTGEVQFVASLGGIDPGVWAVTAEPVPGDLASKAYRGVAGVPVPVVSRRLSFLNYLLLWTPAEVAGVRAAASDDLQYLFELARAAPEIDLDAAPVIQGVTLAVQLEILTEARAARILAGLPPEAA